MTSAVCVTPMCGQPPPEQRGPATFTPRAGNERASEAHRTYVVSGSDRGEPGAPA